MIVVPANPNAINVSMIQTGCLKSEFDSTYPIHLNGIIRQDEFQESIENINRTIRSRTPLVICGIIFFIFILGGIILFIIGGSTARYVNASGFPVLVFVGLGVVIIGMFVFTFGCCIIQTRRTTRMRQAIANESMKYSTRSPTPCSWRLDATRILAGGYQRRRVTILYRLVIEIGHPAAPGNGSVPYQFNQVASQPVAYFPQQNYMPPPPPYYGETVPGFCSRCGAPRQNSMTKFCSSCGQQLNM